MNRRSVLGLLATVLTIAGCGSSPPVVKRLGPQGMSKMAKVLVYPAVDARAENNEGGKVAMDRCQSGMDRSVYESILTPRNSTVDLPAEHDAKHDISPEDLVAENTEKLKTARRGDEDYALFTLVREFNLPGASLRYRAEAYLVDVRSGSVFWKNSFADDKWVGVISGILGVPDPSVTCRAYGRMIGRTYSTIPDLQPH